MFRWRLVGGRERDRQKLAGAGEADLAGGCGKQAVMADAMKPARQHVHQEAADELVGGERHDARPLPAVAPVVLVAEGDAGIVKASSRRLEMATRWV